MRFLFNTFFLIVAIIFCGAFFLHTQVGSGIIGSFSHRFGLDQTTKDVSESRSRGLMARDEVSKLNISIEDKLEAFQGRQKEVPHREEGFDPLSARVDQMKDKLDAAKARADAQHERMMAQKALMDEKAARLRQ